jgi:hypothetical protein
MSHYCTICGNMVPAGGVDCCRSAQTLYYFSSNSKRDNDIDVFKTDARDAEIASLKFILGSKDTHIASLRSTIVATIEAADKEIAELKAQIEKLKTCKNCKWQGSKFATCVQECNWELEE